MSERFSQRPPGAAAHSENPEFSLGQGQSQYQRGERLEERTLQQWTELQGSSGVHNSSGHQDPFGRYQSTCYHNQQKKIFIIVHNDLLCG